MALNENFYEEIYQKEKMWIDMLNSNLINVYYLSELKKFYLDKQNRLNYEFDLTGNAIMKSLSFVLNNMIVKIDYFIDEDKKGNFINMLELNNYFLINVLNNNLYILNKKKREFKQSDKKSLYELRKKITDSNNEDYIDDDFYYDNQKVA